MKLPARPEEICISGEKRTWALSSVSRARNFMSGGFAFVNPDDCQEHSTLFSGLQ
jgi:hypothetical protein